MQLGPDLKGREFTEALALNARGFGLYPNGPRLAAQLPSLGRAFPACRRVLA